MKRYDWLPTESAPEDYPVFLIRGDLRLADGGSIYIPDQRDVDNGWGEIGSTHIVGDERKAVPVQLSLQWYSYTEDRFYAGQFDLPTDRIASLFAAGVVDARRGEHITFDRIIVGMAPGGGVSVWMGALAFVVEVAAFQAQPIDLPWTAVLDNEEISREEYRQYVLKQSLGEDGLARLRHEGVPADWWQRMRRPYRWEPIVTGAGEPTQLWIRTYNGEQEPFLIEGAAPPRSARAVPRHVRLEWTGASGKPYSAEVDMDEHEVFDAFARLGNDGDGEPMTLEFVLGASPASLQVKLKNSQATYRFDGAAIKVYRRRVK